jgi:signal transduction histidine kinase
MIPTRLTRPERRGARLPSLTHFDRKIALGFGALVLVLMLVVTMVGNHAYQRVARGNEEVLITALSGILADSINRTSFSGHYHLRSLLEQLAREHRQLAYIYVASAEGDIIAHSDPALNSTRVSSELLPDLERTIRSETPHVRDRAEGKVPIQEVIMPYRAGYENQIGGIIVAGVSLSNLSATTLRTWATMIALVIGLTTLSLLATYLMSKRFAGPVKQLAWILHGILEHTPVYIGIFRPDGSLQEASANYRSVALGDQAPLRHTLADLQAPGHRKAEVCEWEFERNGDHRVAMATTFPISRDRDGDITLFCSIAADITGQRLAEAELREHRDLLEQTVGERTQALEEANAELARRGHQALQLSQLKESLLGDASFDVKMRGIASCALSVLDVAICQIWIAGPGDRCDLGCLHAEENAAPQRCADQDRCLHLAISAMRNAGVNPPIHDRVPLGLHRVGKLAAGSAQKDITNDFHGTPENPEPRWVQEMGLCAFGGYRLNSRFGDLAGVLAVFGTHPFAPDDEAVLEDLSTTTSYVIQAKYDADALEAANRSLIQRERLATLGELTATVSHELRNPLGTIQASYFLLKNRLANTTDDKVDGALERAGRAIQRCDRIIEALLDFTRETTLHRETTHLDTWLEEELRAYTFPASVTVRMAVEKDIRGSFDRQILYQCLTNVLNNACDAVLEDADSGREKPSIITISLAPCSGGVVLTVEDTGTGIARENLDQIFTPLYSTKGFGTGLGLPLVRKLLDVHGGRIDVTSHRGEGTTVRMTLPLEESPSTMSATAAP